MNNAEKDALLSKALQTLSRRYHLDYLYRRMSEEERQDELEEDVDERLMRLWLGEWEGQIWVHLDNVGDPGAWLDELMGGTPTETLLGSETDHQECAQNMAEQYLIELRSYGYNQPSDFDEAGEKTDHLTLFQGEFVAFLHQWRENVVSLIEAQAIESPETI